MGYAIARAALEAGAHVTLISGPVCLNAPPAAKLVRVTSALDMLAAVKNEISDADIFISVAAVADYRPKSADKQKIKKTDANITLELVSNPDILEGVAAMPNAPFCVGFAAETGNLEENAEVKRRRKKLPLLAANLAQGWALDRLDRPMRAILRAGAYELIARADVPIGSVISEYVDVAHAFYDKRERGFVNGLLDAIAKEARGGG